MTVVEVRFEERYWYPEEGGEVWLSGYQLVEGDRFLARDAPELAERGLRVARFRKPTYTKPAPMDLRQEVSSRCQAVIEALAD